MKVLINVNSLCSQDQPSFLLSKRSDVELQHDLQTLIVSEGGMWHLDM